MVVSISSAVYFILTGAVAGFFAGLLGIGGGVILAPFFFFYFERIGISSQILSQVVFGTNLFIIVFTSISSAIGHQLNRNILWKAVFPLAIGSVIGALGGSKVADITSSFILKKIFAVIMFYAASQIFFNFRKERKGSPVYDYKILIPAGIVEGFVASLLGVGGGSIMVPMMIILFHFPLKKVAGTSSATIIFTSITAVIGYIIHGAGNPLLPARNIGYVNVNVALPIMIGTVIFAHLGVYINKSLNVKSLKKIFGVFLFIVGIELLIS